MLNEICMLTFFTILITGKKKKNHPASYLSLESIPCSFKPITNFSSDLTQLQKQKKKTETTVKSMDSAVLTVGQTAAQQHNC